MITDVAITPDGAHVVYARRTIERERYRSRLWRVSTSGGRPEPLTTADANDTAPAISPDGRTLLFCSDRSGGPDPAPAAQLWSMPLGGGEPTRLTDLEGGAGAGRWSPDGRTIAFAAPSGEDRFIVGDRADPVARRITSITWRLDGVGVRDQHTSVWLVPASGGRAVRVTAPGFEASGVTWSPDGARLGFLADRSPRIASIELPQAWWIPAGPDPGRPRRLGSLAGSVAACSWGPGGDLVLVGCDEPRVTWAASAELRAYLAVRGQTRRLAPDLDRPVSISVYGDLIVPVDEVPAIAWVDDDAFVAVVSDRGRVHPWRFGLDGSAERLADGDVVVTGLAAAAGRVVAVANRGADPGEVVEVRDGGLRRITRDGARWFGPFRPQVRSATLPHPDGHEVDVLAVPARGGRRSPVVLDIHGGPNAAFPPTPWLEMVALADAGIAVVATNPRGSASYGRAFTSATEGAWGTIDVSDLFLALAWAVAEGFADPERQGVMGLSYGGFMTSWLLGQHPGRFRAGVAENPVTDLVGFYGTSDIGTALDDARTLHGIATPWQGLDAMVAASPYVRAHRNTAPLLLLVSEEDRRCPPGQSELAFAIGTSLGRTVEMVRYPQEFHAMFVAGRPDRRVDRLERIVDWFGRHL
jgi:dipeptidyl aminopeptidase/acylaminoacyl peptidase